MKFVSSRFTLQLKSMDRCLYKISCLFFISFFLLAGVTAQNRYLDSLRQMLANPQLHDTARMQLLVDLGNALARNDSALARENYFQAYRLARKKNEPYYMALGMSGIGGLFDASQIDSALFYYAKADSLYAMESYPAAVESRATNKASVAELQRSTNRYEEAITTFLEAIGIMEKSNANNKWLVLAILNSNVANVYHDLKDFPKALQYDLQALKDYELSAGDPAYVVIAHLYVSGSYKDNDRMEEARQHIETAQRLASEIRSADLLYRVNNSWGAFYQETKEYDKALTHYQQAIEYAKEHGNAFQEMNCNRMMGHISRQMERYAQSFVYLQKALSQTRALKNKLLEAEVLKELALVQSKLGNYQLSVGHYQDYIELSDSLKANESKRKIREIEAKYQSEKKRDSILLLQKVNIAQKASLRQQGNLNLALLAGCVLLLLSAALLWRNYKNRSRLLAKSKELHLQQLGELEKEKKLLAVQSLMKGQEEERSRLARDLHDGIGGLLSGVKLGMSTMKGNVFLSEENSRSFANVLHQLDQSISELRRVSHNMMPEALIRYGLKEALENYCDGLNHSGGLELQLQTYGMETRMEQSTEIIIYRMVQELLNNVIRHAEAKKVLIQLVREGDRFNLTVEDDGKGFDPSEIQDGVGLANIKARTSYLDGIIDIVSRRGEGTSVIIEGNCA